MKKTMMALAATLTLVTLASAQSPAAAPAPPEPPAVGSKVWIEPGLPLAALAFERLWLAPKRTGTPG